MSGYSTLLRSPRSLRVVQETETILPHLMREPVVTLDLVVRRSGFSLRCLHRAFTVVHGVSPARYLRDRRLDLARAALLAAPGRPSVVKQAAMDHGFRHLGRFASIYRERFGELPSETVAGGGADRGGRPHARADEEARP